MQGTSPATFLKMSQGKFIFNASFKFTKSSAPWVEQKLGALFLNHATTPVDNRQWERLNRIA